MIGNLRKYKDLKSSLGLKMNKHFPLLLSCIIVLSGVIYFYGNPYHTSKSNHSIETGPQTSVTTVSALIATDGVEYQSVRIFGYTSPGATVNATGQNVVDMTVADQDGLFTFPATTIYATTKELCLQAKDTEGRSSQPTCFPIYFSKDLYGIGPVILAPTFTTNKNEFAPNESIKLSGQSIPNRTVRINVNSYGGSTPIAFMPINNDSNQKIRTIQARTNNNGRFNVTTSSAGPQSQKIYSSTQFNGKNSPKSTTLSIRVLPWWLVILRGILAFMHKHALLIAFIIEALIAFLYWIYIHRRTHPLAIYHKKILLHLENKLSKWEPHPIMLKPMSYLKQI